MYGKVTYDKAIKNWYGQIKTRLAHIAGEVVFVLVLDLDKT